MSIDFHDFPSRLHDFRTSVQVKQDDIFMISAVARLWEYWKSLKTIESDCKCSIFHKMVVIIIIMNYDCYLLLLSLLLLLLMIIIVIIITIIIH